MTGYIDAGYTVVLGSLAVYATLLVRRERLARSRLGPVQPAPAAPDAARVGGEPFAAEREGGAGT